MASPSPSSSFAPCDVLTQWYPQWAYPEALSWMQARWQEVSAGGRMVVAAGAHHPAVVTLGRHTPQEQVEAPLALEREGVAIVRTDRGGGATLHQPGQLVLYPVVDLKRLKLSVPAFTRLLLGVAQDLLAENGIRSELIEGLPGVYVEGRKIASVGFRSRRRVVTHGLSLNLCNDLSLFSHIRPCGETDRAVTSVAVELDRSASLRRSEADFRDLRRQGDRLVNFLLDRLVIGSSS